jgi:hypothetical protein
MTIAVKIRNNGEYREFFSAKVAVVYLSKYLRTDINMGKLFRADEGSVIFLLRELARKLNRCQVEFMPPLEKGRRLQGRMASPDETQERRIPESNWIGDHLWSE